ncbi:diffuse panbronchiolitis critical region gene 1 [Rattus norvegicus]|uniref:Mucin-like protein 3 n=2 Tax=Rattus norvegicus TaxID=10116 RepID=MUCL3_RAT|nr:mucin-like protein 3 precursor [Rattus norvegicus]Q6MG22.1 RecName: Full=Mucin-like protein 3; AltName: Full=Diffuse panbronchiolitis critical region protein 1 homolog; Flags: Precursor [Rattus norvegicus]EDL86761.1 diffuse panbronchiolitis critical region gene 1 [Rattus norvegicus]CAE84025.1 diffuse panbronchiolitis critical region gene 1 [Rattus norvegicus]|eukprot:NP_001003965.1 diffuse panbronchiolitis critical region protein 1 homolog precursor [Rattus norvegicus]
MAQMTSGLYPMFGFFICLLFLPASWEAGANTFQELQKTGEPSIFDHLLPLTPGLTRRALSDHKNSGQHPPDLPKSTATQKPKRQCNTVRLVKPVHKPIDDAKAADYGNTTVGHEPFPASEKNLSSQGKHPMARNERSADDHGSTNSEKRSDGGHSTSAPMRKISCKPVTRTSGTPVSSTETSTKLRTTSQKPETSSHDSDLIRKSTSLPVKSTEVSRTSYRTPRSLGAERHTIPFTSDKSIQLTIEHTKEATRSQSTPTKYERETRSASERISRAHVPPVENHTPSAGETTTQVSAKSTKHTEEATTSTTEKATKAPERPTVNLNTTGLVKAMENTSTAPSPHLHKTETAHQGITGSLTSRMDLRPITSEAHHLQQNTHSLPGGLHSVQEREGSNSFPAWAIVVVILMAVIILLIFLGLIFLVSCASRARHQLTQNSEDAEPEDKGGRNSYPVYLMEQQNLNLNQISSPP